MTPEQEIELTSTRNRNILIRELPNTPHGRVLLEHLAEIHEAAVERTIAGSRDNFEYNKGLVMGIRGVLNLPLEAKHELERMEQLKERRNGS